MAQPCARAVKSAGVASVVRVLSVDYGDRRMGLAVSDELGIAAHGLPTEEVRSPKQAARAVVRIAAELGAERIIVGLPLNMDGSHGPRAEATEEFCELCRRRTNVPVETFDERMSTVRAQSALHEMGLEARKQRSHVDRVAAVLILQDYLMTLSGTHTSSGEPMTEDGQ